MQSIDKRRSAAQENREKIIENAILLFQQHGFENVTIDDIIKAAGFSRGTFYKLFVSKEDLVVSHMVQWNTLYEEYYYNELEQSKYNALEKIRLLSQYMLLTSTKGGQAFQRIAISSGMRDKLLAEKISKANANITKILQDILTDGQKKGIITMDYPVSELIRMVYVVLEGIALCWAGSYDDQTLEEATGSTIEILINTLKL